ncbi:MAG: STAS domain-containing protein [Sporichthyaceae bacterium]
MPTDVPAEVFAAHVDGGDVTVSGEVDLATAPRLRTALEEAAGAGGRITVDLRAVRYLDSAGMAALFEFSTHGMSVRVAPGSIVARVLEISGLANVATVELDEPAV